MTLTDKTKIPPQVLVRTIGEETVILDLASGSYFGLDPIGARIWHLLEQGHSLGEACDTMQQEFVVERERIEQDVLALVESLRAQQLIEIA